METMFLMPIVNLKEEVQCLWKRKEKFLNKILAKNYNTRKLLSVIVAK